MGAARGMRKATLVATALVSALVLASCVQGAPTPVPTYTPTTSSTPTATPTPEPAPTFVPSGTAQQNYEYFKHTVSLFHSANRMADSRRNIDNLVAAGFAKADMEVTPDQTAIGYDVDSILYSVKIGDQCLIAQVFPFEFTTDIAPVLGTGRCLIGQTMPIDW
jgi:hypothetical protein